MPVCKIHEYALFTQIYQFAHLLIQYHSLEVNRFDLSYSYCLSLSFHCYLWQCTSVTFHIVIASPLKALSGYYISIYILLLPNSVWTSLSFSQLTLPFREAFFNVENEIFYSVLLLVSYWNLEMVPFYFYMLVLVWLLCIACTLRFE